MATPSLKLYMIPNSSSMFPHILLRYCGLPFTPIVITVDDMKNDTYVNIKRQVPVLIMDDSPPITENPAIALAISQLAPEKNVLGRTLMDRVRVSEWMAFIAGPLHAQAWGPYVRPFRFTTDTSEEALAAVKETARLKCLERFATIEENLQRLRRICMRLDHGRWERSSRRSMRTFYVSTGWVGIS